MIENKFLFGVILMCIVGSCIELRLAIRDELQKHAETGRWSSVPALLYEGVYRVSLPIALFLMAHGSSVPWALVVYLGLISVFDVTSTAITDIDDYRKKGSVDYEAFAVIEYAYKICLVGILGYASFTF